MTNEVLEARDMAAHYRSQVSYLHGAIDLMLSLLDDDKPASAARIGQIALGRIGND